MSLTKVSFSMIQGIAVNPYDYGAVGDGVTNDTAALQAALNATTAYNSFVLPPGIFLTGALNIADDFVSVIGLGGKLLGAGKNIKILQTANYSNILITGLIIEGQGKDDGGTSSGRGAIHVDANSSRIQIIGNRILNANGSGIVEDGQGYCVISDNEINVTGEHGIYLSSSFKAVVTGNNIYRAGYQSALTAAQGYGIKADGTIGCTINNNVINDSQYLGIQFAANATRNTVSGNTIANTAAGSRSCLVLSGGASANNNISANTLYQNTAYAAVEASANSSNNLIANNIIVQRTAATASIVTAGGGNTIDGNTIIASVETTTIAIQVTSNNNVIQNNYIYADGGGAWTTGISAGASIADNTIINNTISDATQAYSVTNKSRNLYVGTSQYIASVQTTDATVTSLYEFAVKANKAYSVNMEILGFGGGESATYKGLYIATTDGSEVPTVTASNLISAESDAALNVSLVADAGGYLTAKVTGLAATTIDWRLTKFDWREIA
jgi:parallel beta-helix repeat protein